MQYGAGFDGGACAWFRYERLGPSTDPIPRRRQRIMSTKARPVPEGFHTITPSLCVQDGARAIEFYKKAFGAEELMRMAGSDGTGIMHAELKIGDSIFFLNDEYPEMEAFSPKHFGGTSVSLMLYVDDVDKWFTRAVGAGCTIDMPLADMFWGDRFGSVEDPFGHSWGLATHMKDMTPEEMKKAQEEFFAKMATQQG
jgi:PhnB protein